jgi:hypothetical protein
MYRFSTELSQSSNVFISSKRLLPSRLRAKRISPMVVAVAVVKPHNTEVVDMRLIILIEGVKKAWMGVANVRLR